MKRRVPQLTDERGIALVMAMLVLLVLAIALTSIIFFTTSNQRMSSFDKANEVARSLAEAGVNNGISVLSNPANANYLLNDGVHTSAAAVLPDQAHATRTTIRAAASRGGGRSTGRTRSGRSTRRRP